MVKFVEFIPTPNEKHVGIATISLDDKIFLRFKVKARDGKPGYYAFPFSTKISSLEGDTYVSAFTIDSNFMKEQIDKEISRNVTNYFINNTPTQKSVFEESLPF